MTAGLKQVYSPELIQDMLNCPVDYGAGKRKGSYTDKEIRVLLSHIDDNSEFVRAILVESPNMHSTRIHSMWNGKTHTFDVAHTMYVAYEQKRQKVADKQQNKFADLDSGHDDGEHSKVMMRTLPKITQDSAQRVLEPETYSPIDRQFMDEILNQGELLIGISKCSSDTQISIEATLKEILKTLQNKR